MKSEIFLSIFHGRIKLFATIAVSYPDHYDERYNSQEQISILNHKTIEK